ncbi:MAG: glycosyltransferase [Selenomonadaceae bacterium]|nr:glycosyltransferase [Selenomonadaceae bacterium]
MLAISILIPLYNQEKWLACCIESIIKQTLHGIEVIVVNDGSTDKSLEILRPYLKKDSRIKLINQENQGAYAARNRALMDATGEYVAFMDPDDYYPADDILKKLYNAAKKFDVYICGGSLCIDHNGEIIKAFATRMERKLVFTEEGIWDFREYQMEFYYQRYIYKRSFLLENKFIFPPYKRYQDPPFLLKSMLQARFFYAIPDYVYCYRVGHQLPMVDWDLYKVYDMLRGIKDCLQISLSHDLEAVHAHSVHRLDDNMTCIALIRYMTVVESDILSLLLDIHRCIDVELLKRYGWTQRMFGESYNLRVFEIMRQCLCGNAYKQLTSLYK